MAGRRIERGAPLLLGTVVLLIPRTQPHFRHRTPGEAGTPMAAPPSIQEDDP